MSTVTAYFLNENTTLQKVVRILLEKREGIKVTTFSNIEDLITRLRTGDTPPDIYILSDSENAVPLIQDHDPEAKIIGLGEYGTDRSSDLITVDKGTTHLLTDLIKAIKEFF